MELNNTDRLAMDLCDKIEDVFEKKIDNIAIYGVVDLSNHHTFKLNFASHDYFWIQFNYENDICEFLIVLNDQFNISLSKPTLVYSEVQDWEAYLREIMAEIELRIPDKFLKAKGGKKFPSLRRILVCRKMTCYY